VVVLGSAVVIVVVACSMGAFVFESMTSTSSEVFSSGTTVGTIELVVVVKIVSGVVGSTTTERNLTDLFPRLEPLPLPHQYG